MDTSESDLESYDSSRSVSEELNQDNRADNIVEGTDVTMSEKMPNPSTSAHVSGVDESQVQEHINYSDPQTWPNPIPLHVKYRIASFKAEYAVSDFLENSLALKFWKTYNTKMLANEEVQRKWILISATSIPERAYCLPCCLYGNPEKNPSPWANAGSGFTDFGHARQGLERHEKSISHITNMCTWKRVLKDFENPASISYKMTQKTKEVISEWRLILRGILDAVLFLARRNLAFQGHSHYVNQDDCGNFLDLVKLLSTYYPPLALHLERMKKGSVSYLSPKSQNEFIGVCAAKVKSTILDNIKRRKFYSILIDSTPDSSHKDQLSQIIRTVECSNEGCHIEENFIDFIWTHKKTGEGLTEEILQKLELDGLDIKQCRGQGYDNGHNMAGCYQGVQAFILKNNSEARFISCAAHSLNRVGVNAAEKVLEAKLLLGLIQNLYCFFSASTARWSVLKTKVKLTLKSQSATRWSSKAEAVRALYTNYEKILDALSEISESREFSSECMAAADSKYRDIFNFNFFLGLTIWNEVLAQINLCNNQLQTKTADLNFAHNKLNVLIAWLEKFRITGFEDCVSKTKLLSDNLEISWDSGFGRKGRGLNKSCGPGLDNAELIEEIKAMSHLERFKKDFFVELLGRLIDEMKKRFSQIRNLASDFAFLYGPGLLSGPDEQEKAINDLSNMYPKDLDPVALFNEYQTLASMLRTYSEGKPIESLEPLELRDILYRNGLASTYSNSIFLTLPVTVASNERAFSKLKIIKNHWRSSMGQERLTGLAILSIERDIAKNVEFDAVIDKFAAMKSRRVNF